MPEDFGKYSRARNQIIAELLSKTEYVEKVGSGINRIKTSMKERSLLEPIFEYNSSFAITLLDEIGGAVEKTVEKIMKLIKENPKVTQEELVKKTGLTRRGIEWNINRLKEKGVLKRIGPDKGGYWKVVEN